MGPATTTSSSTSVGAGLLKAPLNVPATASAAFGRAPGAVQAPELPLGLPAKVTSSSSAGPARLPAADNTTLACSCRSGPERGVSSQTKVRLANPATKISGSVYEMGLMPQAIATAWAASNALCRPIAARRPTLLAGVPSGRPATIAPGTPPVRLRVSLADTVA